MLQHCCVFFDTFKIHWIMTLNTNLNRIFFTIILMQIESIQLTIENFMKFFFFFLQTILYRDISNVKTRSLYRIVNSNIMHSSKRTKKSCDFVNFSWNWIAWQIRNRIWFMQTIKKQLYCSKILNIINARNILSTNDIEFVKQSKNILFKWNTYRLFSWSQIIWQNF